jgi:hypothetical protein
MAFILARGMDPMDATVFGGLNSSAEVAIFDSREASRQCSLWAMALGGFCTGGISGTTQGGFMEHSHGALFDISTPHDTQFD